MSFSRSECTPIALLQQFCAHPVDFQRFLPAHDNCRDAKTNLYNQFKVSGTWYQVLTSHTALTENGFWQCIKNAARCQLVFENVSELFRRWKRLSVFPLLRSLYQLMENIDRVDQGYHEHAKSLNQLIGVHGIHALLVHVGQLLIARQTDPLADREDEISYRQACVHASKVSTQYYSAFVVQMKDLLRQLVVVCCVANKSPALASFNRYHTQAKKRLEGKLISDPTAQTNAIQAMQMKFNTSWNSKHKVAMLTSESWAETERQRRVLAFDSYMNQVTITLCSPRYIAPRVTDRVMYQQNLKFQADKITLQRVLGKRGSCKLNVRDRKRFRVDYAAERLTDQLRSRVTSSTQNSHKVISG